MRYSLSVANLLNATYKGKAWVTMHVPGPTLGSLNVFLLKRLIMRDPRPMRGFSSVLFTFEHVLTLGLPVGPSAYSDSTCMWEIVFKYYTASAVQKMEVRYRRSGMKGISRDYSVYPPVSNSFSAEVA